jgi:hypothetical protein
MVEDKKFQLDLKRDLSARGRQLQLIFLHLDRLRADDSKITLKVLYYCKSQITSKKEKHFHMMTAQRASTSKASINTHSFH